ncbi:unannotated protein [freshwater metagenome]|uniref:Unannotated protein n=1 Tax=freshwater metagenome TaxID=449393 RepID=A0A6J7QQ56_9ZZZZ
MKTRFIIPPSLFVTPQATPRPHAFRYPSPRKSLRTDPLVEVWQGCQAFQGCEASSDSARHYRGVVLAPQQSGDLLGRLGRPGEVALIGVAPGADHGQPLLLDLNSLSDGE